jgi:predicted nucleic acid-binding protein
VIVVDTNVLSYLWIPGEMTDWAEQALRRDVAWASPFLWRSEFRNVLAGYIRLKRMSLETALRCLADAEHLMAGREYLVPSDKVMPLVAASRCSAYDCEFVALAKDLGLRLVTTDTQLLKEFPSIAIALREFARR